MYKKTRFRPAAALAVAAVVPFLSAACEDTVAPSGRAFEEGVITIDASSSGEAAYLNLADGRLVTAPGADTSTAWHMSFLRFNVRLNGGVSGPGSVMGANLGNHSALTKEQVAALGAADGDSAFQAVTVDDVAGATFVEDDVAPDAGVIGWARAPWILERISRLAWSSSAHHWKDWARRFARSPEARRMKCPGGMASRMAPEGESPEWIATFQ